MAAGEPRGKLTIDKIDCNVKNLITYCTRFPSSIAICWVDARIILLLLRIIMISMNRQLKLRAHDRVLQRLIRILFNTNIKVCDRRKLLTTNTSQLSEFG